MNPNSDKLPVPDAQMAGNSKESPADSVGAPSRSGEGLKPHELVSSSGLASRTGASATDPSLHPLQLSQASNGTVASVQTPAQEDDDDDMSIEKECINKAKAIIEQTSNDPFKQTQELSKVKAELLKRRFGKELKVSEG